MPPGCFECSINKDEAQRSRSGTGLSQSLGELHFLSANLRANWRESVKIRGLVLEFDEAMLRVGLIQPANRIHLDAVHPQIPMQMRAGHPSGSAHETHHLPLLDCIAHIDHDLRLMPKAAVNTPAMVDDRRVPADGQRRSKDNLAWCRCKDLQSFAST